MGILDDAIREHLDLKRKHGAREAELREMEDEAFGSSDQPDPFAAGGELLTEVSPTAGEGAPAESAAGSASVLGEPPDLGNEEPTRLVEPEALRPTESVEEEPALDLPDEPEGIEPIPGQAELPGQEEIPGQERLDDAPEPPSPSESLEDLIAEEEPFPEDSAAPLPPEEPGLPADPAGALEDLEPEPEEPASSVPEPPPPPPETGPEPPGRARGRVDVPTQEHPPPGQTGDLPPFPSEPAPSDEGVPLDEPEPPEDPGLDAGAPQLYDFETDEEPASSSVPADDEFEALGPAEEEAPYLEEERPYSDEPGSGDDVPLDEPSTAVRPALEDEEAYEGGGVEAEESYEEDEEDLWFEKGPPKDFDFDD